MKGAVQTESMSRLSVKKRTFRGGNQGGVVPQQSSTINTELNGIMSLVNGAPTASLTNPARETSNNKELDEQTHSSTPQSTVFGEGRPGSMAMDFDDELPDNNSTDDVNTSSVRSSIDTTNTNNSLLYRLDTGANGGVGSGPQSRQEQVTHLQGQVAMLQETLHAERSSRSQKQPQKLVSGSQFRITGKGESRCEDCQLLGGNLKKSRETIRSLKVQLARLEDKYVGLRKSKNLADDLTITPVPPPDNDNLLLEKLEKLEVEHAHLQRGARTDAQTIDSLQQMLLEWQMKDEAGKDERRGLREALERSQEEAADLKRARDKLREELGQYKVQLDAALSQLQAHGTSHSEKDDEIARLAALLKEAGDEIDRLRADKRGAEQALDKAVGEHAACEQARQAAEEGREAACKEREASKVDALAAQSAQAAAEGALKKAESEAGRLSTDLMDCKGKVVELANENVALMSELTKLRAQLAEQEGQNSKITKMVEKAMASSVRLCVVAPTVNVQVAGKSAKFKGGLEDGKLRSFLVDNVLSKYSFLFEQEAEGVSPDGQPLQEWLQGLLGNMQTTIERHVNNATKDAD